MLMEHLWQMFSNRVSQTVKQGFRERQFQVLSGSQKVEILDIQETEFREQVGSGKPQRRAEKTEDWVSLLFHLTPHRHIYAYSQCRSWLVNDLFSQNTTLRHSLMTEHILDASPVCGAGDQGTTQQSSCPKEFLLSGQCKQPCLIELQTQSHHQSASGDHLGWVELAQEAHSQGCALCSWGLGTLSSVPEEKALDCIKQRSRYNLESIPNFNKSKRNHLQTSEHSLLFVTNTACRNTAPETHSYKQLQMNLFMGQEGMLSGSGVGEWREAERGPTGTLSFSGVET